MTFQQFGRIVIKRWSLVGVCFLLIGLGAFLGSSRLMKPLYQSSVLVEVMVRAGGDPLTNDNILASQQLAQAEAQLASTYPVLGEVASQYRGLSVDDLAKEVTATPKANTQLFEIDVLDPSQTRAANLANSVAAALIKQQAQMTQQATQPNAAQSSFLVIAQPARPALRPSGPNKLVYIGAGLVIGLLLGILLAVLLESIDPRVRTKEAVSQVLEWPVLATLGQTPRKEGLISLVSYNSNAASYGTLHTNLGFAALEKPLHSLVVTSATPGEGKSVVAANLAIQMARSGKNTLLIDANLRHPTLHEHFDIPAHAMGFSNALLAFRSIPANPSAHRQVSPSTTYSGSSNASVVPSRPSLAAFVRAVDIPNLCVMPSGPLPPNPPELLDSKAMQRFFIALSNYAIEAVIFDTPALLGLPDSSILASRVDGTLVVVDLTQARKEKLQQVKALLGMAGARVLGSVVNKEHRRRKDIPYKNTPYAAYDYGARKRSDMGDYSGENTNLPAISPVTSTILKPPDTPPLTDQEEQRDGEEQEMNNVDSPTLSEDVLPDKEQTNPLPVVRRRKTGE